MDYVNFQVCRIADELQRVGVLISGNIPALAVITKPELESDFTIAKSYKSTTYLPHWIRDHRDDPALTVSLFIMTPYSKTQRVILLGFHGPPTCPPSQPSGFRCK